MTSLRRDHSLQPSSGDDSAAAVSTALASLASARQLRAGCGDAALELHLLASLIAECERLLPELVSAAREQGLSWAEIGDLLGTTRAAAWQRFGRRPAELVVEEASRRAPSAKRDR
jgi:hypothetical protein